MGYAPTTATAFELEMRRLGLDKRTCAKSKELRKWCERNKDWYYVPEWLLHKWKMTVDPHLSNDVKSVAA
jgi:hypothetical protein